MSGDVGGGGALCVLEDMSTTGSEKGPGDEI